MSKRWVSQRKKEHYYKQAKRAGYRSRSAYKLRQINDKHNIISKNDTVVDLGAAPGGWLQVARDIVGEDGTVLGVDIQPIEPLEGVILIRGDATKPSILDTIKGDLGEVDVVLSDMSPNITGHYSMDHARSVALAETALEIAEVILKRDGNFAVKVFQGDMFKEFFETVRGRFRYVKGHSPKASRKSSSEIYIIGKGFLGR